MDTIENKIAFKTEFWKGMILGAMAGMLVAVYTDAFGDRSPMSERRREARSRREINPAPNAA
jgi:hypothetical protein